MIAKFIIICMVIEIYNTDTMNTKDLIIYESANFIIMLWMLEVIKLIIIMITFELIIILWNGQIYNNYVMTIKLIIILKIIKLIII